MITSKTEYGLRGAFKVDTFDANGDFVETTDWFDNFITQSGLLYPTMYSFANCFRFLSIGSSNALNRGGTDINQIPTTGCESPFHTYYVSNGVNNSIQEKGTWIGYEGYETGIGGVNSSCTTAFTFPQGPRFFRAWRIPTGGAGFTISPSNTQGRLDIQELSVSPGSGGDPRGCFAFSRIVRPLPIKAGYSVIITYQLQMNLLNAKTTEFSGIFATENANTDTDADIVAGWRNLSGYYRQVWCGLSCVDKYGISYIPKYGNGMEPSLTDLTKYFLYLSPDNAAFDVNASGGGYAHDSGVVYSCNGLMTPITETYTLDMNFDRTSFGGDKTAQLETFYGQETLVNVPTTVTPINIRLGSNSKALATANVADYTNDLSVNGYNNSTFNYQIQNRFVNAGAETISFATVGGSGIDENRSLPKGQRAVFSARMYRLPMNTGVSGNHPRSGRYKTITRKTLFTPANSLGYNNRFGSMVFAYLNNNTTAEDYTYYPIVDTLFYDTSGRSLMQHYRLISGIYLTQRGTGIKQCKVTIRPEGDNIQRFAGRYTFQGPLSGCVPYVDWADNPSYPYRRGNFLSGWNGTGVPGVGGTAGNSEIEYNDPAFPGASGLGAILGVQGEEYNDGTLPYDMGVVDHTTGRLLPPQTGINPSCLYWPRVYFGPPLYVDFSEIVFDGGGISDLEDDGSLTDVQLAAQGYCRPTGYIVHYEGIGLQGFRLLPNHGLGNTNITDYYSESARVGGAYPALSFDNGIEVYMDISWSGDCKGADPSTCQ